MVGQCRRRGGRGLVGLGTRVGAAQTYRFWTGWGWGLNDTDIDTAFDTDTGTKVSHWKVLIGIDTFAKFEKQSLHKNT